MVVNIIATNKYIEFVQPLVDSIDKYFLVDHKITVNVFSDSNGVNGTWRVSVVEHTIPAYRFPDATLLRYHIMTSIPYDTDYIFYLDADMLINDFVGEEILGDLVAVRHPGYFHGGGSWEDNPKSEACVNNRTKYFAGGFQGGSEYLTAMRFMRVLIDNDKKNGIIPIWHDESVWNKYLLDYVGKWHELNPSYCMPELWSKRVYSKIHDLPAKILAREKDFNYYR